MGRAIAAAPPAHPTGFHQEVNASMMEELWRSLAAAAAAPGARAGSAPLDEVFGLLRSTTWADFWTAFPYELREHGSFLDELDALGLLLASPAAKARFERHFEHLAAPAGGAGAGAAPPPEAQQQQQQQQQQPHADAQACPLRLGLRLLGPGELPPAGAAGGAPQQAQQQELPVRRRGQQAQQAQQHAQQAQQLAFHLRTHQQAPGVMYVSPAAPGRLLAATQAGGAAPPPPPPPAPPPLPLPPPPPGPAAGAHPLGLVGVMMRAFGLDPAAAGSFRAAAAAAAGLEGAPAAGAGGSRAGAGGGRLTGRRRSWAEACDVDGRPLAAGPQQAQQAQQPGAGGAGSSAAAAAAAAPAVDNSHMWRAVHEYLTSDDEALLAIVGRLCPYSFAGQLREEGDTRRQLAALAGSRAVPQKVVQSIADRLRPGSSTQLLRLTASSGYSRRAAAAAAALACAGRTPLLVPLAGCSSEEEVEAAVMRGIFAHADAQHAEQAQQAPTEQAPAEQAAQQAPAEQAAQQAPTEQAAQRAPTEQAAQQAPARGARRAQHGALADYESSGDDDEGPPPEGGGEDDYDMGGPFDDGDDDDAMDDDGVAEEDFYADLRDARAPGDGRAARRGGARRRGAGSGGGGAGGPRCSEQLGAHLALLGACGGAPLLLVLDEGDAAALPGGGAPLRALLLRLLCQLPQAAVLLTGSFEPDAFAEPSVLRREGAPARYALPDGELSISAFRVPRPLYYHCLHCF
ncbi:hypothetical protein HT031_006402 [Scenedesmus sp. PABB004]|nr:hypothetical protein HT031_006402 [Scenedesmus sp. PABB004]